MRLMRWLMVFMTTATLVTAAIAIAVPGPHRMLCPACFGLTEIDRGVYTDAPVERHARFINQLQAARRRVAPFFGPMRATPTIVLCTRLPCLRAFSRHPGGAAGVTFGWAFIRMAARGIRIDTLAHELVHAEYHWRLGFAGFFEGRVPFWFHEGLASWIANDSSARTRRYRGRQPWTRELRTQSDWEQIPKRLGKLRYRYPAAVAEVREIASKIGVDGLKRVVRSTIGGRSLEQALAQVGTR